MSDVEVVVVIRTRLERRGLGREPSDPVRIIEQYWLTDGRLLVEADPWGQGFRSEVLADGFSEQA